MEYKVSDFVRHFDNMKNESDIEDVLKLNKKNPFWISTKELLDDKDLKLLREEIIGKERKSKIRRKRRNI
ncbi:MAG: hypothetical protein IMZ41_00235 [Actinobacteria bacterium]|nr:hypothetical protein [Actinomycetota bacterium]